MMMSLDDLFEQNDTAAPAKAPTELRLNLLQNGLDFIREGIEGIYGTAKEVKPRAYKYALLHMFAGTLLVFKERLRLKDEKLLFLEGPRPRTVDFRQAITRLKSDAGVEVHPIDMALLRKVQEKRNAFEHYAVELTVEEADGLVGELVEFLERFLHDELDESLLPHLDPMAAHEVAELAKIAERIRERRVDEWRERGVKYFELSDEDLERIASDAEWHPKHNPDGGLRHCPECYEESLAIEDRDVGVCTNPACREVFMLEPCGRCGAYELLSNIGWCEQCDSYMQHVLEKD